MPPICRHSPGDPNCSSSPEGRERARQEAYEYELKKMKENTPDPEDYQVERVERFDGPGGTFMLLMVKYPSCSKCAYEGNKVMVFSGVSERDALRWRKIDPHFRDPNDKVSPTSAPSPIARFPGNDLGWASAIMFAKMLVSQPKGNRG